MAFTKKPLEKGASSELASPVNPLGIPIYTEHKPKTEVRDRPHRLVGDLERSDPTIEPLPPTPITDEASDRMQRWGLTDQHVESIRDLTSSFRYDLVPQKAEVVAKRGGIVFNDQHGQKNILLPNYFNYTDSLDGQCDDIAAKLGSKLNERYLPEINEYLQHMGRPELSLFLFSGKSRTHFNKEDAYHAWLGIVPEGASLRKSVSVDGSFQEISTTDANGYALRTSQRAPLELERSSHVHFPVGTYTERKDGISLDIVTPRVLGVSSDYTRAYNLGFIEDQDQGIIRPAISVDLAHQEGYGPAAFIMQSGAIAFGNDAQLQDIHKDEIRKALTHFQKMTLVTDLSRAQKLYSERTVHIRL